MDQEKFKKETLPLRTKIISFAEKMLDNKADAEDVSQEVYFKLWFMREQLDMVDDIQALALTITKNLSLNMLKKRDRENGELDVHCESPDFSPLQMLEQQDENALFMRIIEQLPFLQQSVVRMKHINGLETEEIAEITGCSQEAVRMNLSRARKKIKELYFSINK